MAIDFVGMNVIVNFGSREISGADFVSNERTNTTKPIATVLNAQQAFSLKRNQIHVLGVYAVVPVRVHF